MQTSAVASEWSSDWPFFSQTPVWGVEREVEVLYPFLEKLQKEEPDKARRCFWQHKEIQALHHLEDVHVAFSFCATFPDNVRHHMVELCAKSTTCHDVIWVLRGTQWQTWDAEFSAREFSLKTRLPVKQTGSGSQYQMCIWERPPRDPTLTSQGSILSESNSATSRLTWSNESCTRSGRRSLRSKSKSLSSLAIDLSIYLSIYLSISLSISHGKPFEIRRH